MRLVGTDVLHIGRHGEEPVDAGHAVKCQLDDRIVLDGEFERRREIDARFRQDRVVMHIAGQSVEHIGMALDKRPVDVAEIWKNCGRDIGGLRQQVIIIFSTFRLLSWDARR